MSLVSEADAFAGRLRRARRSGLPAAARALDATPCHAAMLAAADGGGHAARQGSADVVRRR
jgi:hypothetical protein